MNSEILNDTRERDNHSHNFSKNYSEKDLFKENKKLRNKIQRDIKKAKSEYFLSELEANKANSEQLWKQLKNIGYSEKTNKQTNKQQTKKQRNKQKQNKKRW